MSEGSAPSPFGDEKIKEIPLTPPPIDLSIAQIRYPRLIKLVNDDTFVTRFASAIADDYPIFDPAQQAIGLLVDAQGIRETKESGKVWRIRSGDDNWTVTIS